MNCRGKQQLNITMGTDVVLHDVLIFDEETFDPSLSIGIEANLVNSLGKRTSLDIEVVDDYLVINVPWDDSRNAGCYGLEVRGTCNERKWATYADSLIRYTRATQEGKYEVEVQSDHYDITQVVSYRYNNSPIDKVTVDIDGGYGDPSVDSTYDGKNLDLQFHNLKGNGIACVEQTTTSTEDDGVNVITITMDNGSTVEVQVRNGSKGTKGDKGNMGDSAVFDPSTGNIATIKQTTGNDTQSPMSQKAVTEALAEVEQYKDTEVDYSDYTVKSGYINSSGKYTGNTSTAYKFRQPGIPSSFVGKKMRIRSTGSSECRFTFTQNLFTNNSNVIFCQGYTGLVYATDTVVTVPSDAVYLFISSLWNNASTPCEVYIEDTKDEKIAELDTLADATAGSMETLNSLIGEEGRADLSSLTSYNNYIDPTTLVWSTPGSPTTRCSMYPVTETGLYRIKTDLLADFCVINSADIVVGQAAQVPVGRSFCRLNDDEACVYAEAGHYIYFRNDTVSAGRQMPEIYKLSSKAVRESDLATVVNAIDISGLSTQRYLIDPSSNTYKDSTEVTLCSFYTILESGLYKISSNNGQLFAFAVLSSSAVTVGSTPPYLKGYKYVAGAQHEEYTEYLHAGDVLYFRNDTSQGGRKLPQLSILKPKQLSSKKSIRCLFVGNSVSQDHVSYVPWLLKNMYGNDIDYTICIAYKASVTIKAYCEQIITGDANLDIFSVANNTERWTNTQNMAYEDIWDNYGDFDIICFEGYYNHNPDSTGVYVEDNSYFSTFIADLKSRQEKEFKLCFLMHQTYNYNGTPSHTEQEAWARIVEGAQYAVNNTPVSVVFSCGAVTKMVNGLIPQSMLTSDNIHNQQGLPCIMGGYVIVEELAAYLGLPSKILNNKLRITQEKETYLNIPGANGTLQIGNDEQYSLCQDAAIKAVKYGRALLSDFTL